MDCVLRKCHTWLYQTHAATLYGRRLWLVCRDCGERKIIDSRFLIPQMGRPQ